MRYDIASSLLPKNTTIAGNGITIEVKYRDTTIVRITPYWISLDSGTLRTRNVKNRLNKIAQLLKLGYHVFQKNFVWYVTYDGETFEFYDGIALERSR